MLTYYAFYTVDDIKITSISTKEEIANQAILKLNKFRKVLYEQIHLNTHLNIDDYEDYTTWTWHIPTRMEPVLEREYLKAFISLCTQFGGIYLDPMESLKDRYYEDTQNG